MQRLIFLLALILSFGRGAIFSVLAPLLLGTITNKKRVVYVVILSVLLLPILGVVYGSFVEGRSTAEDFAMLTNGEYANYNTGYKAESTTFTYRIAWVYERLRYLSGKPVIEWLFGLGLVSEQDPLASSMYRFYVVDYGNQSNSFQLLYSADIGYGNFVTRFGILGTIAMLAIWAHLFKIFYHDRNNMLMLSALLFLVETILETFSSRGISETSTMIPFFLLLVYNKRSKQLMKNGKKPRGDIINRI